MAYYRLPLKFSELLSKNDMEFCDIKNSIAQYVHLINTSYFGECTFDNDFGCSIWEVDFDNLKSKDNLKSLITKSLTDSITAFEKRLTNVHVKVTVKQEEVRNSNMPYHIKKRILIHISGKIIKTNEDFIYTDVFFIGPLSY